jgi:hypothetical protein
MLLTGFDLAIWVACLTGEIVLLLVLLLRNRAGSFPVFSVYILGIILRSLIGMFVKTHFPAETFKHYSWTAGILDECLQLFVLFEIAEHVFAPTGKWAADVGRTMVAMASASAVAAALISWLANPATQSRMQTFKMRSDFFSAVLMSELFVCMVILSSTFGLPWKTHAARIAQGFGAYSLACIALGIPKIFFGLQHGTHQFEEMNHLRSVIYLACEVYWVVMLWAEAPAPRELPEAMRIQIYTLQRQVENDLIRIRSWRNN